VRQVGYLQGEYQEILFCG